MYDGLSNRHAIGQLDSEYERFLHFEAMYGVSVFNDLHILPQVCQCIRFKPISHHDPNESLELIG